MSKRTIIASFFLILFSVMHAQEKFNYTEANSKSYELFLNKSWSELIHYSHEVRKQGIDFFYLQARTGIAWYNLERYSRASDQFFRAYRNEPSFDWLNEYLYYSLLGSGRQAEAIKYASRFDPDLKNKIGLKEKGIINLSLETGYGINTDYESLISRDFSTEVNLGGDYGEAYITKNYSFQSLDISSRPAPGLSLNQSISYLGLNQKAIVDWGDQNSADLHTSQFQYFINPVWVAGKKLNVSSSLSLIFGSRDIFVGGLTNNSSRFFTNTKSSFSDAVFTTELWSVFGPVSPGIEINAGSVNDSNILQLSSWLNIYPLGNTKLYFTPRVYFKAGEETGGLAFNSIGIAGGFQLGKVFFSGQYLKGEMKNFIESNGYIVNNFAGKSDQKISGSLYFPIGRKYQFVLRYINQNMTDQYTVYTNGIVSNSAEYRYHKQTLTGGISWKF